MTWKKRKEKKYYFYYYVDGRRRYVHIAKRTTIYIYSWYNSFFFHWHTYNWRISSPFSSLVGALCWHSSETHTEHDDSNSITSTMRPISWIIRLMLVINIVLDPILIRCVYVIKERENLWNRCGWIHAHMYTLNNIRLKYYATKSFNSTQFQRMLTCQNVN